MSPLVALRDRNFWPYFVGNLTSNCGTWFQNLAQALLVYRLTGSTLLVGVVNFAQFAGAFVLAPWAGSAADRFDRKRLLVRTQLMSFVVVLVLAAVVAGGASSVVVVVMVALVLGVVNAFAVPAMQALVPLLVPAKRLASAVTLNALTFNVARTLGPVLGALVIGRLGVSAAFALNALSYLVLAGSLLVIQPSGQGNRLTTRPRLRDSLRHVVGDPRLRLFLLVVAVVSLGADPVSTLTPGFVMELIHRTDPLVGVLVGAFGMGAVLAAVFAGRRVTDVSCHASRMLLVLVLGMGGFAVSNSPAVAVVALLVGGFGFLAANATATVALQLDLQEGERGRI